MKNYPNLSREERGNMIRGAMMRLTDGRDLEIPQAPPRVRLPLLLANRRLRPVRARPASRRVPNRAEAMDGTVVVAATDADQGLTRRIAPMSIMRGWILRPATRVSM